MTDESKPEQPKIPNLELNRETVEELPERQGEEARGGARWYSEAGSCSCGC